MSFSAPPNNNVAITDTTYRVTYNWWEWFTLIGRLFNKGYSGTVVLAKITGGGTNGSLTVENGLITNYTAPT